MNHFCLRRGLIVFLTAAALFSAPVLAEMATVRVKVIDQDDKPVPGVTLRMYLFPAEAPSARFEHERSTGDAGIIEITLPLGSQIIVYSIAAPKDVRLYAANITGGIYIDSYRHRCHLWPIGDEIDAVIRMAPPLSKVSGEITDESGKPVAGAKVIIRTSQSGNSREAALERLSFRSKEETKATTDKRGRYTAEVPAGRQYIHEVIPPAPLQLYYASSSKNRGPITRAGSHVELSAVLTTGGILEVRAVDEEKKPIEGFDFEIKKLGRDGRPPQGIRRDWKNGSLIVEGLEPGFCSLNVLPAKGSELAPQFGIPVTIRKKDRTRIELVLNKGAVVEGKSLDEEQKPVEGLKLFNAVTNKEGKFVATGLRSGIHSSRADRNEDYDHQKWQKPDYARLQLVAGLRHRMEYPIKKQNLRVMKGDIEDSEDNNLEGLQVSILYLTDEGFQAVRTTTDNGGDYELSRLMNWKEFLAVRPPPDQALAMPSPREVRRTGRTNDFRLQPGHLIRLHLKDKKGRPVPHQGLSFTDTLRQNRDRSVIGRHINYSDVDGLAVIRLQSRIKNRRKNYDRFLELKSIASELLPGLKEIELPDQAEIIDRDVIIHSGATVRGKVHDPNGRPLHSVRVFLCTPSQYNRSLTNYGYLTRNSKKDGSFEFQNIEIGEYLLGAFIKQSSTAVRNSNLFQPEPVTIRISDRKSVKLNIGLKEGGSIEGWVFTRDGARLHAGIQVKPVIEGPGNEGGRGRDDRNAFRDGEQLGFRSEQSDPFFDRPYRVRGLKPGEYRIRPITHLYSWRSLMEHERSISVTIKTGQTLKQNFQVSSDGPRRDVRKPEQILSNPVIQAVTDGWQKTRLERQKLSINLGAHKAIFKGAFTLRSDEAVTGAVFGFPTSAWQYSRGDFQVTDGGKILHLFPYLDQRRYYRMGVGHWSSGRKITGELRDTVSPHMDSARSLRRALNAFFNYEDSHDSRYPTTWQAAKIDFPARKPKVINVSYTIYPVQLTETTEGPCYAFRFPIRLGRFWARPPSQIDVAVELDESINSDDILLIRPPSVVRSGRKLTLTSEQIVGASWGQKPQTSSPTEDLIVVIRGEVPYDIQHETRWRDEKVDSYAYWSDYQKQTAYVDELNSIQGVVWRKADPLATHIVWYGLKKGLGIANSLTMELSRFEGLLDSGAVEATDIAFGPREVWIGTNKGLYSWHRANRLWSRNTPSQETANASVEKLEIRNDRLMVTYRSEGSAKLRFEQDLKRGTWRKTSDLRP